MYLYKSPNMIKKGVISLFISYTISFIAIGLSYIAYSKILTPQEFGLYSIALAIGIFGTLVLDGGLKTTIIKEVDDLTREEQGTLSFLIFGFSLILLVVIILLKQPLVYFFPSAQKDFQFLTVFAAVILLSYPFMVIPTATLERKFLYSKIGWIESLYFVLERGSPVFFLWWTNQGMYSFVWGMLLGRVFRVMALNLSCRTPWQIPSWGRVKRVLHLLREGSWFQLGLGFSQIRDNLHVLLVGPLFGKEWVGYYAWGFQLCLMASQVFVKISSRVSLPMFAQAENFEKRWQSCLYQIKLLTILTAPVLVTLPMVLPGLDQHFFQGKWQVAISFIPLLFFRMLAGVALTPLATLLLVERGSRSYSLFNIFFTTIEAAGAILLLLLLGPKGLAWSCAITAWIGFYLIFYMLRAESSKLALITVRSLFQRPSLCISLGMVSILLISFTIGYLTYLRNLESLVVMMFMIIVLSYSMEPQIQSFFKKNAKY
jgi:O-antigen/teichoic acid export membrane protein